MRKRYLTVIKNERGLEEYNYGVEESKNLQVYELLENEFEELCRINVFRKINNECNLMIDDFESELLNIEDLRKIEKYLINDISKVSKVFCAACLAALEIGVALGIDF